MIAIVLTTPAALHAAEFHVAVTGKDTAPGTVSAPLRTIQRGADLAQPGDVITVHAGVYREHISPPRGGESDTKRIIYQAAGGQWSGRSVSFLLWLDSKIRVASPDSRPQITIRYSVPFDVESSACFKTNCVASSERSGG